MAVSEAKVKEEDWKEKKEEEEKINYLPLRGTRIELSWMKC